MKYDVSTVAEYLAMLPDERRPVMEKLRQLVQDNLPTGFSEQISYHMISYVVPLSIYPKGYHVRKNEPLPFVSLASQKNHIAIYHMGLYGNKDLDRWFTKEYATQVPGKLDFGKSCIRFRNPDKIPYKLLAELFRKMTVDDYIDLYEKMVSERTKKKYG